MILAQKLNIEEIKYKGIDPTTVMSTDSHGEPLSRFGDNAWDFSYQQGHYLNFVGWKKGEADELSETITLQLKTLFFMMLGVPETRFRERYKSHSNYLVNLKKVARMAHKSNTCLEKAVGNSRFQIALRQSIANVLSDSDNIKTAGLTTVFENIFLIDGLPARDVLNISIINLNDYDEIKVLHRKLHGKKDSKRTPLIPSRIYAQMINAMSSEIEFAHSYTRNLVSFFKKYYDEKGFFVETRSAWDNKLGSIRESNLNNGIETIFPTKEGRSKRIYQSREENLKALGLDSFFHEKHLKLNIKALIDYLSDLQKTSALACLTFSGMRTHELQVVPYRCAETYSIKGFGDVFCITTYTSKLNRGEYSKAMLWVTSEVGMKAVEVAQAISECFTMYRLGSSQIPDKAELPLWSSSRNGDQKLVHYTQPLMDVTRAKDSKLMKNLMVTTEDIDELVYFDAFRDWGLKENDTWRLSNHQLRRALVVYASRSGMVSLPSLGTQLKHLSLMMTSLYAENSSFAKEFVAGRREEIPIEHSVVSEFRDEVIFLKSLNFHEKVIESDSKLSGGQGTAIQIHKNRGTLPKILSDRKSTEKGVREGRISATETIVGFCMKDGICDKYGIDNVLPCVFDCGDSVIGGDNGKKLKAYGGGLKFSLTDLDKGTPQYTATEMELERIKIKLLEDEGITL